MLIAFHIKFNKLIFNTKIMENPGTFHFQWHVTDRCNLACAHCYRTGRKIEDLNFKDLLKVLENMKEFLSRLGFPKKHGFVKLSITGGEPLLRKDVFRLFGKINECRESFEVVNLMTNGLCINETTIRKLKELDITGVQVSIEGLEKTHDMIRGEGTFKKTLLNIKRMTELGLTVNISVTVHRLNMNEIEPLTYILKGVGAGSISFSTLVPIGHGEKLTMMTPNETRSFYRRIGRITEKMEKEEMYILPHCSDALGGLENPSLSHTRCIAGESSFTIMSNGEIFPCRRLPISLGNALNDSFFHIWRDSEILKNLRNPNKESRICRKCKYFEKCLGGAKCISYAISKNPFSPDPRCWIASRNK